MKTKEDPKGTLTMDSSGSEGRMVGPYHLLDRLAYVTVEEKDLKGARELYERSLALRQKALGPKNPEVAESLAGLAECDFRAGRLREAEAIFERALALSRKPDGGYYPSAYDALSGYAALLRATHRDKQAADIEALLQSLGVK